MQGSKGLPSASTSAEVPVNSPHPHSHEPFQSQLCHTTSTSTEYRYCACNHLTPHLISSPPRHTSDDQLENSFKDYPTSSICPLRSENRYTPTFSPSSRSQFPDRQHHHHSSLTASPPPPPPPPPPLPSTRPSSPPASRNYAEVLPPSSTPRKDTLQCPPRPY